MRSSDGLARLGLGIGLMVTPLGCRADLIIERGSSTGLIAQGTDTDPIDELDELGEGEDDGDDSRGTGDDPFAPCSIICDDRCVNLITDPTHCGRCGRSCEPFQACVETECSWVCVPPRTVCGLACVHVETDSRHCGACNTPCAPQQACVDGACVSPE